MWLSIKVLFMFFFKQKTAYEMRISDWSSDVCSSDLLIGENDPGGTARLGTTAREEPHADRKAWLERAGHVEHGGGRARVARKAGGHGAHAGVDRPPVGQFNDRPVAGAQTLRIGRADRSFDLHLRRICDPEQFGFGLHKGTQADALRR